jgi:PAS domain S-box-containing protein
MQYSMGFEDEEETTVSASVESTLVRPWLEVIESRDASLNGRVFPIGDGLSIGRRDDAALRILDRSVSRDHARIMVAGDDFTLLDLGTTNGTFVNGVRTERAVLRVGDMVRFGLNTVFRFSRGAARWTMGLNNPLIAARIALWEWEASTFTSSTSGNFGQVTGLTGDLPGDPAKLLALVHPDDRQRAADCFRAALDQGSPIELEIRLCPRVDGSDVWLALKGQADHGEHGVIVSGTVANATSRKRAERELRRMTQVLENMYDAIVVLDLAGRVTDWTQKAEATFRRPREAVVGTALASLVGASTVEALRRETSSRGQYSAEIPIEPPGGNPGVYEIAASALKDDDGAITGYVVAFRDVTEKKALQEQMVLADKMAAIGTLAASIAHEINNPLAFVVGGLDWLAERIGAIRVDSMRGDLRDGDTPTDVVDEMRRGISRIATIVGSMKTLSRKDDHPTPVPVDLRRAVNLAERIVSNEVRQWARLRVDVPDGLFVRSNETRLMQVFINLIMNAVHAIQAGNPMRNAIRVAVERQDPDEVTVIVRDTGCGMSAQTLERIFTPFFTTKPPGMGTGLGLSVTRTIVEASGGSIAVDSEPGTGTTVRMRLPLAVALTARTTIEAPVVRAAPAAPAVPTGAVLVVDDEPMVASALCRLLRSRGYAAESAPDGRSGAQLALTGRFDAIVCDLMMPGFSGVDLHDELESERPELLDRLLFLSGGAFSPREQAFVEQARRTVLAKPWSSDGIVAAIGAIVERSVTGRISGPTG